MALENLHQIRRVTHGHFCTHARAYLAASADLAAFPAASIQAQPSDPGVRHSATDNGPPIRCQASARTKLTTSTTGWRDSRPSRWSAAPMPPRATALAAVQFQFLCVLPCAAQCGRQQSAGESSHWHLQRGWARNTVPWFITANGPVREARLVENNGVRDGKCAQSFRGHRTFGRRQLRHHATQLHTIGRSGHGAGRQL